jgi:hypothetical protein
VVQRNSREGAIVQASQSTPGGHGQAARSRDVESMHGKGATSCRVQASGSE